MPIREWVTKLRKRIETDAEERALIPTLETALAERVYEIQTARETARHRARSAAARRKNSAGHKNAAEAAATGSEDA